MSKAVAKKLRKSNKAEKERLKRVEEQERRQMEAEFAERARSIALQI